MRATFILLALLCAGSASAQVIFVNERVPPGGDGSSWGRAFDSLTDALLVATSGDEIWVATGVYVPEAPSGRNATFTIPGGVQLFGGFRGNEQDRDERDPGDSPTELTGNGTLYTVVTAAGNNIVVDGFFITDGNADGTTTIPSSRGGGVYAFGQSVTLRNNHFSGHFSDEAGSAVTLLGSAALNSIIEDCIFENNGGQQRVVELQTSTSVLDCTFQDNTTSPLRVVLGGVYTIEDCRFRRNSGLAPIIISSNAQGVTIINRCTIDENDGIIAGGVWYNSGGQHTLVNSVIRGNNATDSTSAGAIRDTLGPGSSLLIENTILSGNAGESAGAITKTGTGTLSVTGCTIVGNRVNDSVAGGISVESTGPVTLNNTIIYSNPTTGSLNDERESVFVGFGGDVTAQWSAIEFLGGSAAPDGVVPVNSISADPLFVDADGPDDLFGTADDNLRLSPGSPCIDRGNNLFVGPFVFNDIYNAARFRDDTGTPDTGVDGGLPPVVDIGAAEFQGTTPTDCVADTNGDGMLSPADFNGWIIAFNTQSPACDQNGDGLCTPADFNGWIINFNAGC